MPAVEHTPIPGLLVVRLDVHEDARGWFKENWQRAKMTELGLPDFGPVQHNISFNHRRGVTRGIHVEPWDKLVSIAVGRAFGAWVDLREGATFGTTVTLDLEPATAVFVPRGVGNSYQVLDDGTAYSYLVNDHWRPDAGYVELNPGDETVAVPWPIPLDDPAVELSDKDRRAPRLAEVTPISPATGRVLILGAHGQLGTALRTEHPHADAIGSGDLDLADVAAVAAFDFSPYDVVLNAAAYTAVDAAETDEGRPLAWAVNAAAPALLARAAAEHGFTLVHFSSDYVFDGTRDPHPEDEPFSPLGVYGQTKAAGDLAVATAPRHYLLRTAWVIGEGANFVRTMRRLAAEGVSPSVVSDQVGRLTFTDELARAVRHLLGTRAPYGTYNLTNGGDPMSWAEIARAVFEAEGRAAGDVHETTTAEYVAGQAGRRVAPRPLRSVLDLSKIEAIGFSCRPQRAALADYLTR